MNNNLKKILIFIVIGLFSIAIILLAIVRNLSNKDESDVIDSSEQSQIEDLSSESY